MPATARTNSSCACGRELRGDRPGRRRHRLDREGDARGERGRARRQALPRLDALIAEGVTTVEIKSGYGLDLATNERKSLRAARRLGRERRVDVRTTFLGAHALPPECTATSDAYIDLRLPTRCCPAIAARGPRRRGRRLLREHRLLAGADRARVRGGAAAWAAGQAARRPALEPPRRGARRAFRRAVGRPSRIYRRGGRRGDGDGRHRRGAAARRLLLHPRDARRRRSSSSAGTASRWRSRPIAIPAPRR